MSLEQDERNLDTVHYQLSRRMAALTTAQTKEAKLKEQLAAATRIVTATQRNIDHYKNQIEEITKRLTETRNAVSGLEKKLMNVGKQVFGSNYTPKLPSRTFDTTSQSVKSTSSKKVSKHFCFLPNLII